MKETAVFQRRIKKLNEKLKDTNTEKKEEEPTPPGKMKRLVAVAMAVVGVVAVGCYSLV
jgi:hypothetical protein